MATHARPPVSQDTELPKKKARHEKDLDKSSNGEDSHDVSSSALQENQGEEAAPNPSITTQKVYNSDNNNTVSNEDDSNNKTLSTSEKDHDNNNNNTTHSEEPNNDQANTRKESESHSDGTSQQPSSTEYKKENVVWKKNLIDDSSWNMIPKFDPSRLNEICDADMVFEKELIDIYRTTCEEKLPQLEEALQKEDSEKSILYSHDIKGSSSNIGAELIRLVSERMEHLSRGGKYAEALECLPQLRKSLTETNSVFDKYFADLPQENPEEN